MVTPNKGTPDKEILDKGPKITKMANKRILNIPLFDIKFIQIWLDFAIISTSLKF